MDHHRQHQPDRVYDEMAFPPLDLLACIVAAWPPFSVVFTLWLSMIAALGVGSRPALTRTCSRKASWIVSQVPLRRQMR
jgi:hypothetical protein